MSTDFFERQAAARRTTKWLVVVFVLAVIAIVGLTVAAAAVAVDYGREYASSSAPSGSQFDDSYQWQIPLGAGAGSLALILGGTFYKLAQLAGGGTVVAEQLGGRRVFPNVTDHVERRLLNVVEEMALASGVPVPPVFLLNDEQGINAFAAGYSPSDAVIGVTRGAAEQLSRDELQGVIAHEFSHILNGDMRLNFRLIGVLHGILLMSLVGREIFRVLARSGGGGRRSGKNNGVFVFLVIGLVLLLLGLLGSIIGNLIKAAVSRQREFLADASAVQFTRNPGGIAGALKRIGGAIFGSRLSAPAATEASHMYFSQGVWEGFTGLMATHPPLAMRIRRLDPQWDGVYLPPPSREQVAGRAWRDAAGFVGGETVAEPVPVDVVEHASSQVANPSEIHRHYVAELVAAMPPTLVDALHEPYGARAAIYAALLDRDADVRSVQLRALEQSTEPHVFELTLQLTKAVAQLDMRARLPFVDMALPALRAMSESQYRDFMECFHALVEADQRIALFEWTLHKILLRHLRPQFEPTGRPNIAYYGLQRLGRPISVLLSALARASQGTDESAIAAGARLVPEVSVKLLPIEASGLKQINAALHELAKVTPKKRRQLVDACAATICADERVTVKEAELLRAVSDMLDCPMPPLLAGQTVSRQYIAN